MLIAIVDDDPSMRRSVERLLQARGHATRAFASAEAFLQDADAASVAALVLDVYLGGMSGIELRHRLAAAGSKQPVVFITAHDDDATRREALAAGCAACLLKPFDSARLIDALERRES